MEYQRKSILIHILLYSLFQSLPNHLRTNFLAHRSLTPQSLAPWLFSPQHSLPDCSLPPITFSPMACFLPPTWSLVFLCPTCYLITWSIFLWFSKNSFYSPQLIYPWSILNHPCLILLICDWFAFMTPDLSLPPTRSLVCCCHHWYFAIKYSSDFRKKSLHLHSTMYKPLINPQSPWSYAVDCQWICITDTISIDITDPVLGILFSPLFFCYQIFLWFSINFLALALHNW